jgi:hypothetical protein
MQLGLVQDPTTFTDTYTAPATLITESCKVAMNTTDGWSKTLYTGGDPTIYPSRKALMETMINGTQTGIFTSSVSLHLACIAFSMLYMHGCMCPVLHDSSRIQSS